MSLRKDERGGCRTLYPHLLEKNPFLFYAPQPAIPFKGSAFEYMIDVGLKDTASRFILQEILFCGRSIWGEHLIRYYHSMVHATRGGVIYRDNIRYDPHTLYMEETDMYEGYSHPVSLL